MIIIDTVSKYKGNIKIWCGDFNFDMLMNANKIEMDNIALEDQLFLVTKLATRVTLKTETCIDLMFINTKQEYKAMVINTKLSYHFPQIVSIKVKKLKKENKFITNRKITKNTIKKLAESIDNENWEHLYNTESSELKADMLVDAIRKHLDKYCPTSKTKIKSGNSNHLP